MATHERVVWPFSAVGAPPWDLRLLATIVTVLTIVATYLTTTLKSRLSRGGAGEPPPAPYWVPFVGNTAAFALNTEKYILSLLKRFGSSPFTLSVAGEKMYYIPSGDSILAYFKNSRDLDAKALSMLGLRDQFGCLPDDWNLLDKDNSGINTRPAPGFEDVDPKQRFFYTQTRDLHTYLGGKSLVAMTTKFVDVLTSGLRYTPSVKKTGWTELPDLYVFIRDEMFHASTQALCGDSFFEINPDFNDWFWKFDAKMLEYLRRLPRWAAAKSYAIRDKALASVSRWHRISKERFDWDDQAKVEAEWEPQFGARLMRARQLMFGNMEASSHAGASMDLGMLWAANANVIPSTLWSILGILQSPSLTTRVLAETESCLDAATGQFDITALCNKPLLTSIYLESLRLCVATTTARNPINDKVTLGGYALKKKSTILSISWFGQHDASFWNAGPGDKHSVNDFWAERFLEYPGDPMSGPIRKADASAAAGDVNERERTVEDDKKAKVVTAGIQGHFYPYGGGPRMCPGRFFAKQEMMVAVAVMLKEFEMELVDRVEANKTAPDMKCFPVGALPPDRRVPVRIRRRAA